eukprot:299447-Chlamydomonas_euryale.AAC.8
MCALCTVVTSIARAGHRSQARCHCQLLGRWLCMHALCAVLRRIFVSPALHAVCHAWYLWIWQCRRSALPSTHESGNAAKSWAHDRASAAQTLPFRLSK